MMFKRFLIFIFIICSFIFPFSVFAMDEPALKGKRTYSAVESDSINQEDGKPNKLRKTKDNTPLPSKEEVTKKLQDILTLNNIDEKNIEDSKDALNVAKANYPELINGVEGFGSKLLFFAVKIKSIPLVKALIDVGVDVNIGEDGIIPLYAAIYYDAPEILKLLGDNGADVNVKTYDGETLLHRVLKRAHNKKLMLSYLISKGANVDIKDDYGWTPLHYASSCGFKGCVKILVEAGHADIGLADKDHETAERIAIDNRKTEIAKYLSEKTKEAFLKKFPNPIRVSNFGIFIDYKCEDSLTGAPGPISTALKQAVQDKVAPLIIFGAHLLSNVKRLLSVTNLDSKEWIVSDLIYVDPENSGNLEVIIIVPKSYAEERIKNIGNLKPKEVVENLFYLSKDFKEKTNEIINLDYTKFSQIIPNALNTLLTNDTSPKCIYMTGHGSSIEVNRDGIIANLLVPDALKLFNILEKKNTHLLYVNTCFLGGENLLKVKEMLNSTIKNIEARGSKIQSQEIQSEFHFVSRQSNMIFISAATTQVMTASGPSSLINFFRDFEIYFNKEEKVKNFREQVVRCVDKEKYKKFKESPELKEICALTRTFGSLRAIRSYIAKNITNWVTDYNVSAIPQIRFPANDAKFYSLADTVIDVITAGKIKFAKAFTNVPESFFIEQKNSASSRNKVLVVNISEVNFPVIIKENIPLFISGIGLKDFSFENIVIKDMSCDLSKFIAKAIRCEYRNFWSGEALFSHAPYQETFDIKKLVLGKDTEFKDKNISIGKILEDVFIIRTGVDKNTKKELYKATFKSFDLRTNAYRYYQYRFEDKTEYATEIDEETFLKDKLLAIFNSGNVGLFKVALSEAKIKNPKIIDFQMSGPEGDTLLCLAVRCYAFDMARALIDAGADVNKMNKLQTSPLAIADWLKCFDFIKYLVGIAKADINQQLIWGSLTPEGMVRLKKIEYPSCSYLFLLKILHEVVSDQEVNLLKFKQILSDITMQYPYLINTVLFGDLKTDTLMTLAVKKNNMKMIDVLLEKGANINQVDNNGWAPLHHAAFLGNFNMVKYLVEVAKANVGLKNKAGKTPRALAFDFKRTQIEAYLSLVAKHLNDIHADDADWVNVF